jgi:hypothetical protein
VVAKKLCQPHVICYNLPNGIALQGDEAMPDESSQNATPQQASETAPEAGEQAPPEAVNPKEGIQPRHMEYSEDRRPDRYIKGQE